MKIPQLRKQTEKKSCHGYTWEDDYSWVHQENCLEILRDKSKLNTEVKKYLEEENDYTKKKYGKHRISSEGIIWRNRGKN